VTIGAGAHEAATVGVRIDLVGRPRHRGELARAGEARIIRAIRPDAPAPGARRGSDDAHLEEPAAVPEAVDAAPEIRAFEFHPAFDVDIWIGVVPRGGQRDLLHLPHVRLAGLQPRGGCGRDEEEGQNQGKERAGEPGHGGVRA
jgi:hypothetical protein